MKGLVRHDFRDIFTGEMLSITGGLIAGTLLAVFTNKLSLIPGLFIILPGFLEMKGNISGSMAARLTSGLFLGSVKPRIRHNRILRGNIIASFILAIITGLFLGFLAYFSSFIIFGIDSLLIIFVACAASILSNIIEIPLTTMITFRLFKRGHDPNNVVGPYMTTLGDIISIISLLIVISIV